MLSRRPIILAVAIATVIFAGTCVLIFGPARGARNDISHLRVDLHASRGGIFQTLAVGRTTLTDLTQELQITEHSLAVQQQGLRVAQTSQRIARTTSTNTKLVLHQTTATLATVRRVVAALGPLKALPGKINDVVHGVQTGVVLARSTLALAQETLTTGRAALAVAYTTLHTLRESLGVQRQLLLVARRTLHQTQQLNHKIP